MDRKKSISLLASMFLGPGLFFNLTPSNLYAKDKAEKPPAQIRLSKIPDRKPYAQTGSQFAKETTNLSELEWQEKAIAELMAGNVPPFLRRLKPLQFVYTNQNKQAVAINLWVSKDYLAIGSDEDFLRVPLTFESVKKISEAFFVIPPTRKIVDEIYRQSTCRLKPDPLPPGKEMSSSKYYLFHRNKIKAKRRRKNCKAEALISGHKKDIVITNRLNMNSGRIAIYGWHLDLQKPIQPLSTAHLENYTDYSHGFRMIYKTVWINGQPMDILDVLKNPALAPALTHEGMIQKIQKMLK